VILFGGLDSTVFQSIHYLSLMFSLSLFFIKNNLFHAISAALPFEEFHHHFCITIAFEPCSLDLCFRKFIYLR